MKPKRKNNDNDNVVGYIGSVDAKLLWCSYKEQFIGPVGENIHFLLFGCEPLQIEDGRCDIDTYCFCTDCKYNKDKKVSGCVKYDHFDKKKIPLVQKTLQNLKDALDEEEITNLNNGSILIEVFDWDNIGRG